MIFRGGRSRPYGVLHIRAGVLALIVGTTGLGLAPTASAAGTSSTARAAATAGGDTRTELEALDQARSTGKPVEVTSLRTEKQEVTANPSGTLTLTQHAQPVRARKNGRLVPVDATLELQGDRVAPKATTLDVTFSCRRRHHPRHADRAGPHALAAVAAEAAPAAAGGERGHLSRGASGRRPEGPCHQRDGRPGPRGQERRGRQEPRARAVPTGARSRGVAHRGERGESSTLRVLNPA
ncbi:hypothetical protein ACQ4WX_40965 [Streptomyces lasalocidi]